MAGENLTYEAASEADFDALVQLRIAAMRESLERVGRFDPARARERLRKTFVPSATAWIVVRGERVGFYALRAVEGAFSLDHLYVHPAHQRRGIGATVLRDLKAKAEKAKVAIKVGALRGSDSNRFYQREGFVKQHEDDWDIYYVWRSAGRSGQPGSSTKP